MSEVKYSFKASVVFPYDTSTYLCDEITPTFAQGVNKDERIGTNIKYKYFQFRLRAVINVGTAWTPTDSLVIWGRFLVFWGRNDYGGGLPTPTDVFQSLSTPIVSPINNWNVRVMKDVAIPLSVTVNGTATNPTLGHAATGNLTSFYMKVKRKIHNNVTFRTDADGNVRDPQDRVYFMAIFNNATVNKYLFVHEYVSRISFTDI